MKETNEFYQGYALALGFIAHAHGQESMVKDAMKEHGITLEVFSQCLTGCMNIKPNHVKTYSTQWR